MNIRPRNRRIGILLSGRGSNFEAIAANIASGRLNAEIAIVISNIESAPGLARARERGLDRAAAETHPDFGGSHIIGIDHTTGEAQFYKVPTPHSAPRRVRMDAQDRLWFAEYTGDRIGMFDTISKQFKEWPARHKYTTVYAVSAPDRNGFVYATSNMSERLLRLNTKTGEIIEYQVPTEFDSKKLAHDPTSVRPTVWMVNTRTARLMKVEPLD